MILICTLQMYIVEVFRRVSTSIERRKSSVTKNQIDYQNYLESSRHNAANEQEVLRHNQIVEAQTNTAQRLEAERNAISATQAQAGLTSAQASATSAQANYLNALTNQRSQAFKEEQWANPFGGQATANAVGVVKTGIEAVSGFARFLTLLSN